MNFSYNFPAVRGLQAGKEYYVAMVPLKLLPKLFITDTDEVSPEFRAQRRLNESRIPTIKKYITDNRNNYVFSALSASIDGNFVFDAFEGKNDIGILELDMDSVLLINDGQHRKAAIEEALKDDPTLGNETISVVFFEDRGLKRSQQMFTDLNKYAVRTSNSLSTLYDSRDPFAVLTKEVLAAVPFLNKYTDKEKDNLGANSSKLFTLNNMYKSNAYVIDHSIKDGDKEFLITFWSILVENIIEWQELIHKEISKAELRKNYILCLNITMQAFGILGHYFYENRKCDMNNKLALLREIDWSRDNQECWGGRVTRENGKVNTGSLAPALICNKIKAQIGIPLNNDELKLENKL